MKTRRAKRLAVEGGRPAFAEPLHVGRPNVGDRERLLARIRGICEKRWLSNAGPLVREFEARVAMLAGVKHCVAVCNGHVALEIAAKAVGLNGEVILPSYTFIATAHALLRQGITPVFADIDPSTHNIDPAAAEERITRRTTGIVGVHLWGRPAPLTDLERVAKKHGLHLLFDAAHAFGTSVGGRQIGGFGCCSVFSFHATKIVTCGEGGAIVTDDGELAAKARLLKNFGFAGYDRVIVLGMNGKMSELNAAMGLTNLEALPRFIEANRRNHETYVQGLRGIQGLKVLDYDEREQMNYQYVVVEVDNTYGCTRDELVEVLHAENVLARRYFWPGCHRMQPYAEQFPHAGRSLPMTEMVADHVIVLPTGEAITTSDVRIVCEIIRKADGWGKRHGRARNSGGHK